MISKVLEEAKRINVSSQGNRNNQLVYNKDHTHTHTRMYVLVYVTKLKNTYTHNNKWKVKSHPASPSGVSRSPNTMIMTHDSCIKRIFQSTIYVENDHPFQPTHFFYHSTLEFIYIYITSACMYIYRAGRE